MTKELASRRKLILGAASAAAAVPTAVLLTPQEVIAANASAPQGTAHRGPAHDWLGAFVVRKMKEDQQREG